MRFAAMVLEKFNKPLELKQFEINDLPQGYVLVRTLASGVCGSDVHIAKGEDPRTPVPIILGHEGVGEVIKIFGEKKDLNGEPIEPGDWIIWNRGVVCRKCFWCTVAKQPHLCPNRKVYGINMSCKDHPHLFGCYAEAVTLLPEVEILKIPKNIDPAILVIAACSGATAMHTLDSIQESLTDKTIVVQGVGPLGIFCAVAAKTMGASRVVVIGGSPERLSLAKDFVDVALSRRELSEEERRKKVLQLTHGRGADIVIEAAGDSNALLEGLNLIRRGGIYLIAGVAVPQKPIPLSVYEHLVVKGITLHGVWVSDTEHLVQAVHIVTSHPKVFENLITHRFKLDRANEALKCVEERKALKATICFD
ncbi:zinc-binding dehydrogenase [Pseudothermotoga sp.]|nr:zinc-binding dehydrogenase [Pseudothermotoga sp.]MCX7812839.1 zinc-binding dehydrogenase [Pseudothermotoga sp.]MDW8140278.1 zinc-binding dehydrogenase [Pseudothermotoga sp.]